MYTQNEILDKISKLEMDLLEARKALGRANNDGGWHENFDFESKQQEVEILMSQIKNLRMLLNQLGKF